MLEHMNYSVGFNFMVKRILTAYTTSLATSPMPHACLTGRAEKALLFYGVTDVPFPQHSNNVHFANHFKDII